MEPKNNNENLSYQENNKEDENINIDDPSLKIKSKYISAMNIEEINILLKNLNLDEEKLKGLNGIIKNGKDLISIYNDEKFLDKINFDLHDKNILRDTIEKYLEEQLKINIEIEKGKNIILNIENEPKYKLKEIYILLEKLFKKKIYLSPMNNPFEILNPNTLIVKKIILNPNKYCNLCIFNEEIINQNKKEKEKEKNIVNEKKEKEPIKDYNSLFANKKNITLPEYNTNYQMPSQNKNNNDIKNNINNGIKLNMNQKSKLLNEDFKYKNLLSIKDTNIKDKENENNENNLLNNNKPNFNIINNTDYNINKNYFTQRNFNTKNISNDNGDMFQQIMKKRNEKNVNNDNDNISFLKKEKELNNNMNKTENRYDFIKYQDIDKDNLFINNKNSKNIFNSKNNNINQINNKNEEINDINNLILKTQTPNQISNISNANINDDSDDILKALREKYSLQNNNTNNNINDDKMNLEYKKEYKPKTPIAEGRRIMGNDNLKFNNFEKNSNNDALENKFLNLNKNDNLNENLDNRFYFSNKNKINNNGFDIATDIIGNNRLNRPSPGLGYNAFQYKTTGYKSSFNQNNRNNNQEEEDDNENLVEINGDNE